MKTLALTLAVAALVAGCAQVDRVGDAAAPSYSISCPAQQMGICLAKASELCPKGYDVVDMNRLNLGGGTGIPLLLDNQVLLRDRVTVRCET